MTPNLTIENVIAGFQTGADGLFLQWHKYSAILMLEFSFTRFESKGRKNARE
jgi:hypothetical protein